jgi:hypothetical protein
MRLLPNSLGRDNRFTNQLSPSPFLQYVSSRETFDEQLRSYAATSYVQLKYASLLSTSEAY